MSMRAYHTVEKIGGTSVSATDVVLRNVLIGDRTGAALYNRIFVVSAFAGMTDLLLSHKKTGAPGVYARFLNNDPDIPWQDALTEVREAMKARNAQILPQGKSRAEADSFVDDRIADMHACLEDLDRLRRHGQFRLSEPLATVMEMLAGLGEAHSAFSTALLLRDRGVNAVAVDLTGWSDGEMPSLDARLEAAMRSIDLTTQLPIVTGYAACKGGMVSKFSRGYSEMTFSRLAVLTRAYEAIIHKEFHLSSADPRLVGVERARKIGQTNYDVADQLANLGMEAIHPRASRGLRQSNIPLRVRNTFDREDEGTLICCDYVSDKPRVEIVAGIRSLIALQFFEQDMVGEKGYDAAVLEVLTQRRARIVSKTSNANTITHHLDTDAATMRKVIGDLEERYPNAKVEATPVAMVSVIGSDISKPGIVALAMQRLQAAEIRVLALQHQIRNVDVQFLIDPQDFERAVQVLHDALITPGMGTSAKRVAA